MADIFAWRSTTAGGAGTVTAKVRRSAFGDGYSQSSADGINPNTRAWPVSFTDREEVIQQIAEFLEAHVGASFLWKPPLSVQGYYQCDSFSPSDEGGGIYTLTATFTQTFQP